MKKQTLLIALGLLSFSSGFSQWSQTAASPFRFGETNWAVPAPQRIKSIGVGSFTTFGDQPRSAFHINQFYLQGSTGFNAGQLFRTDGTIGNLNAWTFFTGATAATSTEKFSLYTMPNSSEVNLQATQTDGELIFRAGGTQEKFRITDTSDRIFAFGNYPPYGANLFVPTYPAKFNINDRNNSIVNNETTMLLRTWGRGLDRGVDPNGVTNNYTLAEFIQSRDNTGDGGIFIQGSRAFGSSADVSFIDFGNNDITNGGDYLLTRIAGGLDTPPNDPTLERSVFRIYTNAGVSSPLNPNDTIGLIERFRITSNGNTGIGNYNNSSGQGVGTAGYIDARLDIDGDMRIRTVLQNDTLDRVLVIDSTDRNRVYYRNLSSITGQLGGLCTAAPNPLTGDYRIQLNTNDFFFTDFNATPSQNRVAIGYACGTPLFNNKFSVRQENTVTVGASTNAIRAQNVNNGVTGNTKFFRGVWGVSQGTNNFKNMRIGGDFRATTNGTQGFNVGVRGYAGIVPNFTIAPSHVGGLFISNSNYNNTSISIGVAGIGGGSTASNIGVYGQAPDLSTTAGPDYAGYFNGDVLYTGQVSTSDAMFKYDIEEVENALDIISDLKPSSYFYDATAFQGKMKFQTTKQYGFIAQDVEQILPELVGTAIQPGRVDTLGNVIFNDFEFKTLNYNGFFAILTKGIQEQQNIIDSLENVISNQSTALTNQDSINNALYNMITACCSNNNAMTINNGNGGSNNNTLNVTDVTLSDAKSIVLNNAVPNPFADMTTITYVLTNEVQKAQMLFYDVNGKLINSVELTPTEGQGRLNVFADDLSNGIYTYTLVADGQIIDTKRMVKNK